MNVWEYHCSLDRKIYIPGRIQWKCVAGGVKNATQQKLLQMNGEQWTVEVSRRDYDEVVSLRWNRRAITNAIKIRQQICY